MLFKSSKELKGIESAEETVFLIDAHEMSTGVVVVSVAK